MPAKLARIVLVLALPVITACSASVGPFDEGIREYQAGKYGAALHAFDEAVRVAPRGAASWNDRGLARMHVGQYVGALSDLTKAQATMLASTGLESTPGAASVAVGPGRAATLAQAPPPPPASEASGASASPSAMPAFPEGSVTPESLDARVLTLRGISRELDGDRQGAVGDLRAAAMKEQDARRRAVIQRFLQDLEGTR